VCDKNMTNMAAMTGLWIYGLSFYTSPPNKYIYYLICHLIDDKSPDITITKFVDAIMSSSRCRHASWHSLGRGQRRRVVLVAVAMEGGYRAAGGICWDARSSPIHFRQRAAM